MRFRTTVAGSGRSATGLPVPDEVVAALGGGKRPKVRVTLGGHTYRSSIATVDGRAMISLSAENRAAAGVGAGEQVDVDVEVDDAPRTVVVPPDLAAALDAEPAARRTFDALSYSNQRWHVLSVEGAKAAETRRRRIERSVAALRDGKVR